MEQENAINRRSKLWSAAAWILAVVLLASKVVADLSLAWWVVGAVLVVATLLVIRRVSSAPLRQLITDQERRYAQLELVTIAIVCFSAVALLLIVSVRAYLRQ